MVIHNVKRIAVQLKSFLFSFTLPPKDLQQFISVVLINVSLVVSPGNGEGRIRKGIRHKILASTLLF
jgi:hypothetical protein